jgi:hypothetical protein
VTEKVRCLVPVDSGPHGRCVLAEGHQGDHIGPVPAKGGGFLCPSCNRVWAAMVSFDMHAPCEGAAS